MTPARRVLPGAVYLVTRRCSEQRLFLRPSRSTNAIFLYVLALAARRYRVLVHAFCVLSNHVHLVVTDCDGRLPAFMQYLDSLVARAVNASLDRFEGFWSNDGSYSAVETLAPSDVLAKIAYVLANPVAAGLVKRGSEWPGLWSAPERIGAAPIVARRPDGFFDPKGNLPELVELELAVPPGLGRAPAEMRARVAAAVRELEEEHQRDLASRGRRFLGAARVLVQDPRARPAAREPRFRLKPRIASRDRSRRIEALRGLTAFAQRYREALTEWRSGARDVVFPAGTYLMRVMHGVQCAGAA